MIHRLLLPAAAACALVATPAFAGSIYYGADGAPETAVASAPSTGASADYRAVVSDEAAAGGTNAGRRAQPNATASVLGPDGYLPIQQDSMAFRHASGTEGAP